MCLDGGATNHMTGNPEPLDCIRCLVPCILATLRKWWSLKSIHSSLLMSFSQFEYSLILFLAPTNMLTWDGGWSWMEVDFSSTTKEETSYTRFQLLETYSLDS